MTVLLPSVTVRVLSPVDALDAHGGARVISWDSRGPFPAHVGRAAHAEDVTRERSTTTLTATIDPAAWPVGHRDRLLVVETGQVLEVQGARLVPDLAGARVGHVSASCLEIAEAGVLP